MLKRVLTMNPFLIGFICIPLLPLIIPFVIIYILGHLIRDITEVFMEN